MEEYPMKKFLILVFILITFTTLCFAQTRVRGYFRNDGTYVQPHYRSSSNNTVTDNYSFKGNINPYTGEEGHNYYRNDS